MTRLRATTWALLFFTSTLVIGQNWDFVFERPGRYANIADIAPIGEGWALIAHAFTLPDTTLQEGAFIRLTNNGQEIEESGIWGINNSVNPVVLIADQTNGKLHMLGMIKGPQPNKFLFHNSIDATGVVTDSALVSIPDVYYVEMNNAFLARSGDIFAAVGSLSTEFSQFDIGTLVRLSNDGDSIDSRRFYNPNQFLPRDIIETGPDTFLLASLGTPVYGMVDQSNCSYMRFTSNLDTLGYFTGTALAGEGTETTPWNTINDHLHMRLLPSGNLVVAGRIGALSLGQNAAVEKLSGADELLAAFAPESEFPQDYPGIYACLDTTTDGNLLFAYMSNFQPGPPTPITPTEPGRIHIYKLDTSLNVLCANVLDGFPEDAFYWLNRIKATSDGGYLLIGGRVDVSVPDARMVGWVRKYGPEDCFTEVEEYLRPAAVSVFPNPAANELHWLLNGPALNGLVELFDMSGRTVGKTLLRAGQATCDVRRLPTGAYAYRIVGTDGRSLASGRWMKE